MDELEAILDAAEEQVQTLADEYRLERLIPFCREHGWTFAVRDCTWGFRAGHELVDYNEVPREIQVVLSEHVFGDGNPFAFYIAKITESDIAS